MNRVGVRCLLVAFALLLGCDGGREAVPEADEDAQRLQEMIVRQQQAGVQPRRQPADSIDGDSGKAVALEESMSVTDQSAQAAARLHDRSVYSPTGRFLLQVGAYRNRSGAEQVASDLKRMGYPAQVISAKQIFRVRIGFFEDVSEAEAVGRLLKQGLGLDYWVTNR